MMLRATFAICAVLMASVISRAAPPDIQPATSPSKISLNFKDTPLDTVLNYLSQNLGFEIIKDGPIDARVTIMSKQPVSPEEAIALLSAALKVNGFTVSRQGQLLRIASRDKAKKGNVPVHFGNNPADVPDTDELITQVVPVENVNATKLRDDLKPLIGSDADLTANEGSNSIIITDTSSSVHRIVQIISQLDQHEAATAEMRIIQLKHANATATAKLIDTLFKSPAQSSPQPQPGMPMQMPQGQPGAAPSAGSQRHGQTVITAADDRTNTLLVMASNSALKTIDEIVQRLDTDNPNPAPALVLHAYPLKFAEAEAAAKLINNVFKPDKGNDLTELFIIRFTGTSNEKKEEVINAVADDRTNTLIVTASAETQKAVEALIQQLDASPMVSQALRVIHLKYADAESLVDLIQDMFQPKKEEEKTPQSPFAYYYNPAPQEPPARGGKVNVSADKRTNTLIISAPREMLDVIENVVRELDANATTEDTLFIYHLRNGQSAHLEYTLNVLFGNFQQNQNNQNVQGQQNPAQLDQQNQNQFGARTSTALNTPANNTSSSNRRNNRSNQSSLSGVSTGVARAATELSGKVLVVANQDTNSLLVATASKYEQEVRAIIAELDQPVPQVLIKCLVAEVKHDNSQNLGVDFSVLNLRASGKGQTVGGTLGATDAAAGLTVPGGGGLVVKILEDNGSATIQALAQANKLDVLSRPYILTSDNQEANIIVGDQVPFITGSFTDSNGGIHNEVQYQDIGILLDVTPHVNPEGLVVMDVSPQISSLTGQTVTIQQGVNVPVFQQRSASSRVAIKDGQTIVIGGLMEDQKTDHVNKIPVLGDIPILGKLFQYSAKDKTKTELLIFLTPHVAPQPERLAPMSEDELRGTKLTPNAVAPGIFDEHMRGLQRGNLPQTQPGEPLSPVKSIDSSEKQDKQQP